MNRYGILTQPAVNPQVLCRLRTFTSVVGGDAQRRHSGFGDNVIWWRGIPTAADNSFLGKRKEQGLKL